MSERFLEGRKVVATKKGLFEMPPMREDIDVNKMLHGVANKGDFETIEDMSPYGKIVNKPKTKSLKSQEGPDINSGDMGDPVALRTDCGWGFSYHLAKSRKPAYAEVSAGLYQDDAELDPEVRLLTTQAKTFRTAVEVVDFLVSQGWDKFFIEEGSPLLKWAFWAYLTHLGKTVTGYKPTEFDQIRLDNASGLFKATHDSVAQLTLSRSGGMSGSSEES